MDDSAKLGSEKDAGRSLQQCCLWTTATSSREAGTTRSVSHQSHCGGLTVHVKTEDQADQLVFAAIPFSKIDILAFLILNFILKEW